MASIDDGATEVSAYCKTSNTMSVSQKNVSKLLSISSANTVRFLTKTATRSCRTRKRAGVDRRSHSAALHVRPPLAAAAGSAAAATDAAADAIRRFTD